MKNLFMIFGFLTILSFSVEANNHIPMFVNIESSIDNETDPPSAKPFSLADHNVIVKGRRKTIGNVGDDVVIRCKGRRGNCVIFTVPDNKLVQDVTIFDEEGVSVDRTITIDASKPVSFLHSLDSDGEPLVDLKMTEIK